MNLRNALLGTTAMIGAAALVVPSTASAFDVNINGFLNFMPTPDVPASAGAFLGALAATGYMFPVIKGVEVIVGALLLSNRFVPLALTLLAPIMVNIVLFHAVLAPAGLGMVLTLLALQLYLAWSYRDSFRAVLTAHARSAAGDDPRVGGDGWISVRAVSADGAMTITEVYDPQ